MSDYSEELASAVGKIAVALEKAGGARDGWSFLSPGDVSGLRRMDPKRPCSAFWRILETFVPEGMRRSTETERRWALVCQGMAFMAPRVHDMSKPFGRALYEAGFASEDRPMRVNRLLAAEDEVFEEYLLSACRYLAAKAQPANWVGISRLFINQDAAARRDLAKSFFTCSTRGKAA